MIALLLHLLAAAPLIPQNAPIGQAGDRVKDPARDPLPDDPEQAAEVRRGYKIFLNTPRFARRYARSSLSCGSCHLNAGQKEGSMPLVGIASIFPDYNKRSGRPFTLEERIVG